MVASLAAIPTNAAESNDVRITTLNEHAATPTEYASDEPLSRVLGREPNVADYAEGERLVRILGCDPNRLDYAIDANI